MLYVRLAFLHATLKKLIREARKDSHPYIVLCNPVNYVKCWIKQPSSIAHKLTMFFLTFCVNYQLMHYVHMCACTHLGHV